MTRRQRDGKPQDEGRRDDIAIIGMSCLFPGAPNLDGYWRNILGAVDSITDPPPESWNTSQYYDPGSSETDRVYCKRGGYLGSLVTFDPLEHGTPPVAVGGEPDQWLALRVAREAMVDAGYEQLDESVRRRTAVIMGKGTYLNSGNSLAVQHSLIVPQTIEILKSLHPEFSADELEAIRKGLKAALPNMGPEIVPGLIPNIAVGRIANRLDLMGPAYTVDAACASSLVAVQLAIRDLRAGECDLALVGGSQVWMPVPTLSIFCQLGALSKRQQIRPFDKDADGTLLGEGIGMIVLKRLEEAERDGDRIYSLIRGVGVASDGRGLSVMAPRLEGEELALRRAYDEAGIAPSTVGLIEAHGTGTPVGDVTEMQALSRVYGPRVSRMPTCAVGSVKSMISHTIPAAGVAGLIKVALSLYHKVLPPTLNYEDPNPQLGLERTPFYINTTLRPWVHGGDDPRRGGVSAFGFGGINSHALLEEYRPSRAMENEARRPLPEHRIPWDCEVCLFEGDSPSAILSEVGRWEARLEALASGSEAYTLTDLAYTLSRGLSRPANPTGFRLAVVATSFTDLREKLASAATRLSDPKCRQIREVSGIYYAAEPLRRDGKLAFLIPGEGAQYPNMLANLCLHFPDVRNGYDAFDRLFQHLGREHLPSDYIFPRTSVTLEEAAWAKQQLWRIEGAIESVRVANLVISQVLERLAIRPDAIVGHSSGEYAALQLTGMIDLTSEQEMSRVTSELIRVHEEALGDDFPQAVLLALGTGREQAESLALAARGTVHLAMDNCPHQVVLVCDAAGAESVIQTAKKEGIVCDRLPFDRPYHSPMFIPYTRKLRGWIDRLKLASPRVPLHSCTTTAPFPDDDEGVRTVLLDHWIRPVEFRRTIEALHDQGYRLFVEAGPRGNLTAFVEDTLRGRRFCAVPANVQRRSDVAQLNHLVGILAAQGVGLDPTYLFEHRGPLRLVPEVPPPACTPQRRKGLTIQLQIGFPPMSLPPDLIPRLQDTLSPSPVVPLESVPRVGVDLGHSTVHDGVPSPSTTRPFQALPREPETIAPAISDFLRTMEQFLVVQGQVIQDCIAPGPVRDVVPADPDFPLLGQLVSLEEGRRLVARRVFEPEEDLYLLDHSLGLDVSDDDPALRGLIVMPLAMSLEILAEAAARLLPGRTVVRLLDVRAYRWIGFAGGPQTLEVTADRQADDDERVAVRLFNLSGDEAREGHPKGPVVEATVILAEADRPSEAESIPPPRGARPSRLCRGDLYGEGMFHGPLWQGVVSIDRTSEEGSTGTLQVLSHDEFLRSQLKPRFTLDPVVLDAAGQIVGFWTMEHLARGRVVFPFRLDALEVNGPRRPEGEYLGCVASIRLVGEQQIRSDIDVLDGDGRSWMRLLGWYDRRFDLEKTFEPLILPGQTLAVSGAWPEATAGLPRAELTACRRLEIDLAVDREFWSEVWAHRILGRAERERFRRLMGPASSKISWLARRTVAKEAVRELLADQEGLDLKLADIEIYRAEDGFIRSDGAWRGQVGRVPAISMAHADGMIVALAAVAPRATGGPARPGVALGRVQDHSPGGLALRFDRGELQLFEEFSQELCEVWMLRAWCARQAASRALGYTKDELARATTVVSLDGTTGIVCVEVGSAPREWSPLHAGDLVEVVTTCDADVVVAATLLHESETIPIPGPGRRSARNGIAGV